MKNKQQQRVISETETRLPEKINFLDIYQKLLRKQK